MEFVESRNAMNLQDGRQSVAVARKVRGGWLLVARNFCWIDERARQPNVFHKIQPAYLTVSGKAAARKILQGMAKG